MKKILSLLMAFVLVFGLVACANDANDTTTDTTEVETVEETTVVEDTDNDVDTDNDADLDTDTDTDDTNVATDLSGPIHVVSREDGSGTRGAFVEIVGVEDENGNDVTVQTATIQDGTGKVIETVASDDTAIGYISLGSLDGSNLRPLAVNGVEATPDNVLSGDYPIQRPLNIAYQDGSLSELAQDFINFIMSEEGQNIAVEEGYVQADANAQAYNSDQEWSGELNISGSTSVAPLVESAAEAYEQLHPNVTIVINSSGSSAGVKDAMDGVVDFGMASRALNDDELEVVQSMAIALDGIAVVVAEGNPATEISLDTVQGIYTGEITDWSEVR